MKTLIVDTSVIVKWININKEENTENADAILEDVKNGHAELLAPELAKYELGNVLLKGKQLTPQEAIVSLGTVYSLPITFVEESEELARQAYNLAYINGITYYDASFMSLAKQYNATLVTDNIKHQGKATDVKVKSLSDY